MEVSAKGREGEFAFAKIKTTPRFNVNAINYRFALFVQQDRIQMVPIVFFFPCDQNNKQKKILSVFGRGTLETGKQGASQREMPIF